MTESDTEQKRKRKYNKKKKQQTERVKERNKKRVRVREKVNTPEERKEENKKWNIYVHRGDTKIHQWRNTEIYKNLWEIEKRDFSRIFIFILASDRTSKNIIVIKTTIITITLFILMKSSYPTYHNNKI